MGWTIGDALHAAAFRDPDLLRPYLSIAAMIATPEQALAAPGLIDKVMSLSANIRGISCPDRAAPSCRRRSPPTYRPTPERDQPPAVSSRPMSSPSISTVLSPNNSRTTNPASVTSKIAWSV